MLFKRLFKHRFAFVLCMVIGVACVSASAHAQIVTTFNVLGIGYYGGDGLGPTKGGMFIYLSGQPGGANICNTVTATNFLGNRLDIPNTHSRFKQFAQLAMVSRTTGIQLEVVADTCIAYGTDFKIASISDTGGYSGFMQLK
jgi:hypothetical protein